MPIEELLLHALFDMCEYKALKRAERLLHVECEHCRREFVYVIRREVEGRCTSLVWEEPTQAAADAEADARDAIRRALRNTWDLVPCPSCFRFQSYMAEELRARAYSKAGYWGAYMLVCAGPAALFILVGMLGRKGAMTPVGLAWLAGAVLLGLLGLGLNVGARWRRARYDPNNTNEAKRARVAARRATPVAEFHARIAERNREDYALATAAGEVTEPFPLFVWVTRKQVINQDRVPVPLPGGEVVPFSLRNAFQRGELHPLTAADGRSTPFAVHLRVFHTTRRQRWSKP